MDMETFECPILTISGGRKMACHVPIEVQRGGGVVFCGHCVRAGRCVIPALPGSVYVDLSLAPNDGPDDGAHRD